MSEPDLHGRVQTLEVDMGKVSATLNTVVDKLGTMASDVSSMTSHVSRLEAGQGKIPVGTIFGALSTLFAAFGLILVLTLNPLNAKINDLETANKTTIEEHVPELASDLADLQARMIENETELGHLWSDPNVGVFAALRERASMGEMIKDLSKHADEARARLAQDGWSRSDHHLYEAQRKEHATLMKELIQRQLDHLAESIREDRDDLDTIRSESQ